MASTALTAALPLPSAEPAAKRVLRVGFGSLWLLDGLLQLQPGMWSPAVLVGEVWQAAAQGPAWLVRLVDWSIQLAAPQLGAFNWLLVIVELALGAMLLAGRRPFTQAAAWGSLLFGAAVWIFGDGLGGLLAGGSTILAAAALLAPEGFGLRVARKAIPAGTAVVAATLAGGALLQLQPVFWGGIGLSAPIAAHFMMAQPAVLRDVISMAAGVAAAAPGAVNVLLILVMLALALALLRAPGDSTVLWTTLALLAVLWITAQDAGMLPSGMATDPNTMPALAVLLVSGWAGAPQGRRTGAAPAAGTARGGAAADGRAARRQHQALGRPRPSAWSHLPMS